MKPDKSDQVYLDHIAESIRCIREDLAKVTKEKFLATHMVQDAVLRRLIIVGEASKKLSQNLKDNHPEIPWRKISGTRDILVHEYFDVDLEKTWEIVRLDLPALELQIIKILSDPL